MLNNKQKKGFTLIELLVVVAIIAILAIIALVIFSGVTGRAKDAKIKSDLDAIRNAYEAHYDSTNGYSALQASWFNDGKTPLQPDGTSYTFVYGPDSGIVPTQIDGFKVSGSLSSDPNNKISVSSTAGGSSTTASQLAASSSGITLDANASGKGVTTNVANGTFSLPFTVGSGGYRILVVGVSLSGGLGVVNSISWTASGQSAQPLTYTNNRQRASNASEVEMWYLVAPNSGLGTILVTTNSSNTGIVVGATSWINVNQVTPLDGGTATGANGYSGTATVINIPTATGEVTVDAISAFNPVTVGSGQTSYWNQTQGNNNSGGSSKANSSSMSWTLASQAWAINAISLKPTP